MRWREDRVVTAPGVHARLGVVPDERCPLRRAMAAHELRRLVPAGDGGPPQVVVGTDGGTVEGSPRLDPVVELTDAVVCRLTATDGRAPEAVCGREHCLCATLDWLPVRPYDRTFGPDAVSLSVAATENEVRRCIDSLETAGFTVDLQQLSPGACEGTPDLVVVDRGVLTARQREVARLAVAHGYSGPNSPPADVLAGKLSIEPSTFSEHLRAVRWKVGKQLFPDERPR